MPWAPEDAPSHNKKANTPKKKRQWAKVANAALKTYNGNEGKAIAAANAAIGDRFWNDNVFLRDTFVDAFPALRKSIKHKPTGEDAAPAAADTVVCPACGGAGRNADKVCDICAGTGRVTDQVAAVFQKTQTHHETGSPLDSAGRNKREDDDPADREAADREAADREDDETDRQTSDAACADYRAPLRDAWYDRDFSAEQRKQAAEKGEAMSGGGYPIRSRGDLKNAIRTIGRAANRDAAIKFIKKRARALDLSNLIPAGWGDASRIDPTLPMLTTPLRADGGHLISVPLAALDDGGGTRSGDFGASTRDRRSIVTGLRMYDAVELDDAAEVRFTRDGYLTAMPRIARTGIQLYRAGECGLRDAADANKIVRVYRPPESVFATDAWHTYTHLPVTLDHPSVAVDATNWKRYAVGETADEVLRDGQAVRVPMMLRDAAAVAAFKAGQNQLSVGYDCDLDWTPGVTVDGESYDAIQHNIRANHLAVVAAARGGSSLTIGDDIRSIHDEGATIMMRTITIDGLDVQMTDQAAAMVTRTIHSLSDQVENLKKWKKSKEEEDEDRDEDDAKKDAALAAKDAAIKTKDKALEVKDGEIAALKKQLGDARAELEPAKLDARVKDRLAIVTKAKGILGDKITCDGKTDAEIRKAVVVAKVGDAAKDWSDDRIVGAFDTLSVVRPNEFMRSSGNQQRDSIDQAVMAFGGGQPGSSIVGRPGAGYTHQTMDARDKAYADYDADVGNAWRGQQPGGGQQQH